MVAKRICIWKTSGNRVKIGGNFQQLFFKICYYLKFVVICKHWNYKYGNIKLITLSAYLEINITNVQHSNKAVRLFQFRF